jgi:hypothetical protein
MILYSYNFSSQFLVLPSFLPSFLYFFHYFLLTYLPSCQSFLIHFILTLLYLLLAYIGNDYYEKKGAAGSYVIGFSGSSVTAGHGTYVCSYCNVLYSTILYYILLYSTLLHSTLLYSTLLYSTLLYSNISLPLTFFIPLSFLLTYF